MTKKTSSTARHYVNNKELLAEIVSYRKLHRKAVRDRVEPPRIPEPIGQMIYLICNRLGNRYNFVGYSYRDEMIADALENCVGAVVKFDPRKSNNPHAYFTMCAWRAMIRRIGREQKQHVIKHKNLENMDLLFEETMPARSSGGVGGDASSASDGLRRHYEVIEKYEDKIANKKKKLTPKAPKPKKKAANRGD